MAKRAKGGSRSEQSKPPRAPSRRRKDEVHPKKATERRTTETRRTNMEAKVDIRKLQLLNDRIAQTIEALNQVRLSVHGLQHAGGYTNPLQMGYGQQNVGQFGGQFGYGMNPF